MQSISQCIIARRRLRSIVATLSLLVLGSANAQGDGNGVVTIDGKTWSQETSGAPSAWSEASEFCDTLETAGFTDWRLPSLMELEALHDASTASGLPEPLSLDDCCAWSSENLADLPADRKGELPDPAGPPSGYYWAFLFSDAVSYYSNGRFPDGTALCVRDSGD